jgi:hypothetical protein
MRKPMNTAQLLDSDHEPTDAQFENLMHEVGVEAAERGTAAMNSFWQKQGIPASVVCKNTFSATAHAFDGKR